MLHWIYSKKFQILIIISIFLLTQTSVAFAKILVVTPHPDDEALVTPGIIYNALQNLEEIRLVVMTNGDYHGVDSGYSRQNETIAGMQGVLGLQENNIIFLGYPDAGLDEIYTQYLSPNSIYTSLAGQTHTYGRRGLGGTDYHSYRFGTPANYNKPNILMDLESIISDFRPDHIFTISEYDDHPDHFTTYLLVRESVGNVASVNPTYRPIIHKSIVWGGDANYWPNPADPNTPFNKPLNLDGQPINWNYRESINVPLAMRDPVLEQNLKYQTIMAYESQISVLSQFLLKFIHKDEFFWAECSVSSNQPPVAHPGNDQSVIPGTSVVLDGSASRDPEGTPISYQWVQVYGTPVSLSNPSTPTPSFTAPQVSSSETLVFRLIVSDGDLASFPNTVSVVVSNGEAVRTNIAFLATVTASSQNSATGQLAVKAVDGVVDGYPGDSTREWASVGQLAGAWIDLEWSTFQSINRIRLYDRPNLTDQVLAGRLIFSDGSAISVGPLPNGSAALTVDFPTKSVTSVNFNIDQAVGQNIGLAEIEVFRVDSLPGNTPPVISAGPTATPSSITDAQTSSVGVTASDADGDTLGYSWSATGGSVSGTGATATYTPPRVTSTTVYRVSVTVSDGKGGSASGFVDVTVNPRPLVLTSLSPSSATSGGTAFTLTVNGSGFVSGNVVRWNGSNRRTTFVSATRLRAAIPASDIALAGTVPITVSTSPTGGETSNSLVFTITDPPVPTITSLSPSKRTAGSGAFILTINGTGFVTDSAVQWNGSNRTTTFISATRLRAAIQASDTALAGKVPITVFTPTPGGGTSNSLVFTIR